MRGHLLFLRFLSKTIPSDPRLLVFSPRYLFSRPITSRGGSRGSGRGRNPEFSRNRGPRRGEFELENFGRRGGGSQTKSLIEDEAELSDWVGDLKTDSIRVGLSSESEDSDRDSKFRDRISSKDRSRERDSFSSMKNERGGRGGRDRFSNSKRRGESDSDDNDDLIASRRSRGGSNGSFSRNSRGSMSGIQSKRKFDSSDDSDDGELITSRGSRRGGSNGSFSRNSRGSMTGIQSKRKFDSSDDSDDDDDDDLITSRRSRGGSNGSFLRNSRGSMAGIASKRKFDSDDDLPVRRERGHGARGRFSSPTKRGGRVSDFSNGPGRQGLRGAGGSGLSYGRGGEGRGMSLGRQAVKIIEDDEEGEDDDDDEEDEDDDVRSDSEDGDENFVKNEKSLPKLPKEDSSQLTPRSSTEEADSYLSQTRFDQCSISPLSLQGIKAAGYEKMTVVQEATLPVILKGKDVLAKAKTGTGKTVAFLLPAIEAIVKSPPSDRDQKRSPINVLVICPTRELASQAMAEANTLLKYHSSLGVQVVIGGTRIGLEQKQMKAKPCQILVATPGRLRDHIENTPEFATLLMGVKVLVLDEADHLLDMGFRKDIEKIIAAVPKQRQTLLFSATVPEEVRQICHIALKRDHEFINTVVEGSEETHSQVRQMHIVASLEKQFSILYHILTKHISEDADYKVLVFCTTAMVTRLVADLLSKLSLKVREIHSRKPQSYRTRVSDEFRKSKGLILVTSDVSARGVDYPDVTLVIQVGLPADREQYIHRLGRTGRKGKEGQGILILAPWEEFFLTNLKTLPITKASVPAIDPDTIKKVEQALSRVEMKNKEAAYQAWLGFYNSNKNVARDKHKLVALANEFSGCMGLDNPPAIPQKILSKMGLRNIPGLRSN